jgi:MSHA pilin protein MshC
MSRKSLPITQTKALLGFTLIELIMVIVIIGILSVSVLPQFTDKSVFEARGFRDETMALLRYAQKSAVAQRRTVCVTVDPTGVSLNIASLAGSTTCNTTLTFPSTPNGGSGLSGSNFNFIASGATNQTGTIELTVSGERNILVDAVTGYVR